MVSFLVEALSCGSEPGESQTQRRFQFTVAPLLVHISSADAVRAIAANGS
jgi:hypothetical protein